MFRFEVHGPGYGIIVSGYVLFIALHLVKAVCVNAKMIKLNLCLFRFKVLVQFYIYCYALCVCNYTTLTNVSKKYLVLCDVYTGIGGIKLLFYVCTPVRKIMHELYVRADNP